MKNRLFGLAVLTAVLLALLSCESAGSGGNSSPEPGPLKFSDAGAGFNGNRQGPSCSTADIDNDGDIDIFFSGYPATALYRNKGNNTFESGGFLEFTNTDYSASVFADVDCDGDFDLIRMGRTGSSSTAYTVVELNNGSGSFTSETAGLTALRQGDIAAGDVNNDGYPDILIQGMDSSGNFMTCLYLNNGDPDDDGWDFFSESTFTFIELARGSVEFGHLNDDDYLDLLITGLDSSSTKQTMIYLNDGDSGDDGWDDTFSELPGHPLPGMYNCESAIVDIDNDQDNDIILAGDTGQGECLIFTNDGNAGFTDGQTLTGVSAAFLVTGDPDDDGDPDLIVGGWYGQDGYTARTFFYRNNEGTFEEEENIELTDMQDGAGSFFDSDNDGDLDLAICGGSGATAYGFLYLNGRF